MQTIRFHAKLTAIGSQTILRLPLTASSRLPSRGLCLVEGTLNGTPFQTALEPDGRGSHWFPMSEALLSTAGLAVGDEVSLAIQPMTAWPEPKVPADLTRAFAADLKARALWQDITTLARWDWIRWIAGTKNPATRAIRIEKTVSKLKSGKRAACCFNRSECTDVSVSHNGMLLEPGTVREPRPRPRPRSKRRPDSTA